MNPLAILGVVGYFAVEWLAASLLARWIGWGGVALVMMVLFIVGVAVCRRAGFSALRATAPVSIDGIVVTSPNSQSSSTAMKAMGDAGLRFVAGFAIALPGLVTSLLGGLMLIPGIRRGVGGFGARQMRGRAEAAGVILDENFRPTTFKEGSVPGDVYRADEPREPGPAIEGVVLDD
ncbi:MAG: FxsA family protein [Actinomycetes bacterium]|jgi:UPF0716 family protein affecting phage T7 exclusion